MRTAGELLQAKRKRRQRQVLNRRVFLRFIKGLAAAVAASAIVYVTDYIANTPDAVPVSLVPVITATLLALQKWIKEKG